MSDTTDKFSVQDARRRRKVRVVGYATGELFAVHGSQVKVRLTDINGYHRFWRGPADQVEAL